jgi:hypothetical protein
LKNGVDRQGEYHACKWRRADEVAGQIGPSQPHSDRCVRWCEFLKKVNGRERKSGSNAHRASSESELVAWKSFRIFICYIISMLNTVPICMNLPISQYYVKWKILRVAGVIARELETADKLGGIEN